MKPVGGTTLEWVAAVLVVVGVSLMAAYPAGMTATWIGGIVALTLGVQLAIDCGKHGGGS